MGIFKDWNNKNGLEKTMAVLYAVFLFFAAVFVLLQLFNVWEYALSVALPLLAFSLVFQGISEFRTQRAAAYVTFGGAFGMFLLYIFGLIR